MKEVSKSTLEALVRDRLAQIGAPSLSRSIILTRTTAGVIGGWCTGRCPRGKALSGDSWHHTGSGPSPSWTEPMRVRARRLH